MSPIRADVALVERGLVRSRTLARRLIEAGAVLTDARGGEVPVQRAAQPIHPDQQLRVLESDTSRYVSRGGNKLEAALAAAAIDCRDVSALDVGMSTGGFTHCLLTHGARQVLGIEVGHGQLDPILQSDPRVVCLEHTHIRDVDLNDLRLPDGSIPADGFALIVVDLSFIAASQQLAHLAALASPGGRLVCLIKPQFELGPDARNKHGIVRHDADLDALRRKVSDSAMLAGWQVDDWQSCAISGGDGNQEYFLIATRLDTLPPTRIPRPDTP
ncbi:MAG: TlyA family RNA methyltransferase [Lautropia sp.]|nr:TlyA family RNA methyltransferase [Lautropia sp.]